MKAMMLSDTRKVGRVDQEKESAQNGPLGHATGDRLKARRTAFKDIGRWQTREYNG